MPAYRYNRHDTSVFAPDISLEYVTSHGSAGVPAGRLNNKRALMARFKCSGAIYRALLLIYTTGGDASAPMAGNVF